MGLLEQWLKYWHGAPCTMSIVLPNPLGLVFPFGLHGPVGLLGRPSFVDSH
jgi:hypothetical protein